MATFTVLPNTAEKMVRIKLLCKELKCKTISENAYGFTHLIRIECLASSVFSYAEYVWELISNVTQKPKVSFCLTAEILLELLL